MRYYETTVNTNAEKIKRDAKVNLKDYDYDSPIAAVNRYVYMNLSSGTQFLIYGEEGHSLKVVFHFKEDLITLKDAFNAISKLLDDVAGISLSKTDLEEISTFQYIDAVLEARRRVFANNTYNYIDQANDFIYDIVKNNELHKFAFNLDEKIISLNEKKLNAMYDKTLIDELNNIEKHSNKKNLSGNMVHYVISGNSTEAAMDITETLMQKLMKANRVSTRRVELITQIDPEMYKKNDYIETVIKSNFGGTVVIDLTEKFGHDPVEYGLTCKFIEKLVKKYRNDCLFVFTYNKDNPGFSYSLLPSIQKYVATVKIKEATGTKKDAIAYLQELIKASEYKKYYMQADEFMESSRKKNYTQSDVLDAYDRFEPWCMNKNFFGAYSFNMDEEFSLEHDAFEKSPSEKLNALIGLESVKKQIEKVLVSNIVERARKDISDAEYPSCSMHMIFGGNPGTAKTTVAKLFAGITKERGILKSGIFVERGGNSYETIGGSFLLARDFEAAKGGVLFIDEAYGMKSDSVITSLIQLMENNREDVICILAGYNDGMRTFLERNEGLKSRIPYWVDFPDYTTNELVEIFKMMINERGFSVSDDVLTDTALIFDKVRHLENFGNGRYVRNLVEDAIKNQSVRLYNMYGDVEFIPEDELFALTSKDILDSEEKVKEIRKEGEAQAELDRMIGLSSVKKIMNRIIATFKMNKFYSENGIRRDKPAMHMVFTGNPGTAKTTTARLVADIFRDERILPSGQFVEVGRSDLVGEHVGSTAIIVKKKFREAQGGVLFIDEAYSLCDSLKGGYGEEAINTIVQEMENHREDTVVIFAGYPNEMKAFLDRNPGMASRIAFHVEFEDYTPDELCDIAKLMLDKKNMSITDEALLKLKRTCEKASKNKSYGNGRYVRKLIEEAEMNLASRVSSSLNGNVDISYITTIDASDIEVCEEEAEDRTYRMGFGFN